MESPGRSPIDVKQCIEELLKFTLESHINSSDELDLDLGLSKDYCYNLLSHEDPVYKRLASALHEYMVSSGTFDSDIERKKIQKLNELVLEEGRELVKILKSVDFEIHVQEPFFTQLKNRRKTVEGRCAVGDYNSISSGALILCNKCLVLEVQDVHRYISFSEMLQVEGLEQVLPGVKTIEEGVQVYRNFYSEEKEKSNAVVAICVSKLDAQPYVHLNRILSGLGDEGLQLLTSFIHMP